ncbi:Protein of unknown function [Pyronema omphalodes CBS 100304]|uniref:Uncharacterized protein n=1 Tax=Pyronema omphalodes (strain CBS 100304) TaxID=1076935 RepID=U4LG46_PYROM|nr:Protein of unknown function [Pyronema omphalodes CBS 100304]
MIKVLLALPNQVMIRPLEFLKFGISRHSAVR